MSQARTGDSSPDSEDARLMERLKLGEPDAVVELCNVYFDRLYAAVFNQVERDEDATQDIVQETFLAAIRSAGKFRGGSKIYTWLHGIANKKVADFYRQQKRKRKYESKILNESEEFANSSDSELTTLGTEETEKKSLAVQEILADLPLHYRQVLMLKYVEEMPVLEISKIMSRSPKSVEGLLTRARKELQARLTTHNEG